MLSFRYQACYVWYNVYGGSSLHLPQEGIANTYLHRPDPQVPTPSRCWALALGLPRSLLHRTSPLRCTLHTGHRHRTLTEGDLLHVPTHPPEPSLSNLVLLQYVFGQSQTHRRVWALAQTTNRKNTPTRMRRAGASGWASVRMMVGQMAGL